MLLEFTHFIFTRIDSHSITNNIIFTTKDIFYQNNTVAGPKCDPNFRSRPVFFFFFFPLKPNSNSELLVEILQMNGL
jgi:hypothetical protein